jgi:hypothetical protein
MLPSFLLSPEQPGEEGLGNTFSKAPRGDRFEDRLPSLHPISSQIRSIVNVALD